MTPTVQLSLMLQARQPDELEELAESVSTPNHSVYGSHLTRLELSQQIALNHREQQALQEWLESYGMIPLPTIALAAQELVFRATIEQLTSAFGTKTSQRLLSPKGVSMAQLKSSLPRSLAGYVHTIRVLPDLQPKRNTAYWGLNSSSLFPEANLIDSCQFSQTLPTELLGLRPIDIQQGYSLPQTITGKTETIAVMALGGYPNWQDLAQFWQVFGIERPEVHTVQVTPMAERAQHPIYRWETTMEVQWLGAIAPDARIVIYFIDPRLVADPWSTFLLAVISDKHFQPTIACTTWSTPERQYYQVNGTECFAGLLNQCAVLGITVIAASGDWGVFDGLPQHELENRLVSDAPWPHGTFPAVAQGILAVGGTQVTALDPWQERAWSAPISSQLQADLKLKHLASSGGFSEYIAIPHWQQSVLQSHYTRSGNSPAVIPYGRGFPDVVLAAWGCNQTCGSENKESAYWGFMDQWRNDAGGTSWRTADIRAK